MFIPPSHHKRDSRRGNRKRYVQGINWVAVGEIGLDHVRARQDKDREQQAEVFPRFCQLAREVSGPVVIYCRGAGSTVKEGFVDHEENIPKEQL